jgi:transcriptional regulator with PAS, ATPase and Fis domain
MQISYEIEIKEREAEIYKLKSIDLENKNKTILRQKKKLEKTLKQLKETEIRYDNIKSQLIDKIDSNIIGDSKEIKAVMKLIHRVAQTDNTSILITGESGTGKELVARAIHNFSERNNNNFCAVNVAAIPETLFESEFYGYVKNAFTGARSNKAGWFQTANRGTLFLDEIGTMNASIQSKLLRVLEDKKFTPVGSTKMQSTDVRIIAATNENLENQIDTSEFRNDLYHRLSPFVIHLPPLRDRVEDIPLLIEYFVKKMSNNLGIKILNVEQQVYSALMSYSFPGNIRELRNMIERALILTDSSTLKLKDFNIPRKIDLEDEIIPLFENEKNMVLKALRKTGFHQTNAAKLLGITAKSLERRMIKYNIKKTKN